MRKRMALVVTAVVLVSAGLAGTGVATDDSRVQPFTDGGDGGSDAGTEASVVFAPGTSSGYTMVVDQITLPEGGFVTIHDATLTDGKTLESVRGTSAYLSPGTHENVVVHLEEPLSSDGRYFAMAHRDTNDDRTYSFVASGGGADGPYTSGGDVVMTAANVTVSADVSMTDQASTGETVVVDRVELAEGGFVTVHDGSLLDGDVLESVRGSSTYLPAGVHENVRVQLDSPVEGNATLVPMAHRDTDGDRAYSFVESEGGADGPYASAGGRAVVDTANVTTPATASASLAAQSTGGHRVVVESVYVPQGGFVTIHDASLQDGAVFDSVRGSSAYLEPGLHRDVAVTLDAPLSNDTTLVAMAHRDTDGDRTYSFVDSEGASDGPYTETGGAVVDAAGVTVSADVVIDRQRSDGKTVVVRDVDLSEGGFVTVHDASLLGGAVFDSVRGTSAYLEAGHHENVTITLSKPIATSQTLVPMAHRDTNGDETYSFVDSEGAEDGPYTADGGAVVDTAEVTVPATVALDDQTTDGTTVVVESVTLQDGGFVTIHDGSLAEGAVFDSVRGTSAYLPPGTHEDVRVELDSPVREDATLVAMAHRDTDGDRAYSFVASEGAGDGPYVSDSGAIVDSASVTVETTETTTKTETKPDETSTGTTVDGTTTTGTTDESTTTGTMDETTATDGSGGDGGSDTGGQPGFGLAVAVVALLAAGLLAARRRD